MWQRFSKKEDKMLMELYLQSKQENDDVKYEASYEKSSDFYTSVFSPAKNNTA